MDIILETKDLTKTYKAGGNHINAVDHTSICVERGDFVTIVGKSGSGKSTLLHLIGGLDYPTSGEVWIDNECITNMNEEDLSAFRRRKIGFIFQAFNLVPSLNVWENIILPIGLDDRKPDMVYLKEIIELLGLSEKLNNLPNTLSGGQQQRVAIARALATKPAIVLADEPTGNLDSKTSDEVMALLKTSAMKYEQTLIVITHNEDLKTQIMSLDGVESIDEKHTVLAEAENVVLETQRTEVGGISENDLLSLNKSLKRGTLDYDELVHSNGIIFTWDILFEQYGFEIGDTIQLTLYDGNKKIPFTGTLMASTNSSDDTFLIADEVLQQLITETNPASAIYITVQPEKFESVKAQIDTLQQENTRFMFKSYDEELGIAKQLIRTIQYTIYGLLIVIGIIGYISLINTMITSILVRKKELGILQAIGLSDKQLRQMIHREGLFFTFGTLALSLTIGNGLGYLLVRIIINTQILTISQYEYPITQTLVLIVAVVIGQIAITVFVNRYIHKQSLVERMRD